MKAFTRQTKMRRVRDKYGEAVSIRSQLKNTEFSSPKAEPSHVCHTIKVISNIPTASSASITQYWRQPQKESLIIMQKKRVEKDKIKLRVIIL